MICLCQGEILVGKQGEVGEGEQAALFKLRQQLAMSARAADWRWRMRHRLPCESSDWSAADAFDLAGWLFSAWRAAG